MKIAQQEKERLKKIYKSKAIIPFGYKWNKYEGYAIYFNKILPQFADLDERNEYFRKKYPILIMYLDQKKAELESILINAKENPRDIFFPRRGTHIKNICGKQPNELSDLEPLYERGSKIFIRYITDENIFGYSQDPYYATSDTYFLWPRGIDSEINYPLYF